MSETSGRLLTLLSLLQSPREWPGPELAARLSVTTRTVRNDVERLRQLGYPVEATRGSVGGYRLAAGAAMPPLLLEDDEAVAIALGLRTVTGGAVGGIEENALRALTKLQQVLPQRLARQVDALQSHTVRVAASRRPQQEVDGGVLAALAAHARDRDILRFGYADHHGASTERRVEPYRLVNWGRRWYLVAWDLYRADWRTFRVDRISAVTAVGHRFTARPLPADDIAAYVASKTRQVQRENRPRGRVRVHTSADAVLARMGAWAEGGVVAEGPDVCVVDLPGRSIEDIAFWLGVFDVDFEVLDPPELAEAVRRLAARYARAAG